MFDPETGDLPPELWETLPPNERDARILACLRDFEGPFWIHSERLLPAIASILRFLESSASWELDHCDLSRVVVTLAKLDSSSVKDILRALSRRPGDWNASGGIAIEDARANTLADIGPAIIPSLLQALVDDDRDLRELAGLTLSQLGEILDLDTELQPLARIFPITQPVGYPPVFGKWAPPWDLSRFLPAVDGAAALHPFRSAPFGVATEGGIVYFPGELAKEDFRSMLKFLSVQCTENRDYAVFADRANDFGEDRYLIQLRIITSGALQLNFRAHAQDIDPSLLAQERTIGDLLWTFILHQQAVWATSSLDARAPAISNDGQLRPSRGRLAFGFMAEGWGVYRIWSRFGLEGE
jgi:hypothetical protein